MCQGHQMSHILAPVCLSPGKSTAKLCLTSWEAAPALTLPVQSAAFVFSLTPSARPNLVPRAVT